MAEGSRSVCVELQSHSLSSKRAVSLRCSAPTQNRANLLLSPLLEWGSPGKPAPPGLAPEASRISTTAAEISGQEIAPSQEPPYRPNRRRRGGGGAAPRCTTFLSGCKWLPRSPLSAQFPDPPAPGAGVGPYTSRPPATTASRGSRECRRSEPARPGAGQLRRPEGKGGERRAWSGRWRAGRGLAPPAPSSSSPTYPPPFPGGSRRWGARSRRGRALGVAGCVSGSAPRPRRLRVAAVARAAPGRRPGRGEGLGAPARVSRSIRAGAGRRGVPSGPLGRRLDVPSGEPRRPARARRRRPGRWPGPRTERPPDDADAEPALPRSKPPVLSLCPLGIRRPRAVHGNLNCWNLKHRTRLWLLAFFWRGGWPLRPGFTVLGHPKPPRAGGGCDRSGGWRSGSGPGSGHVLG